MSDLPPACASLRAEPCVRTGLAVTDAPTMFVSHVPLGPGGWLPSAEGMRRTWYASYELLGLLWYRWRQHE